MGHTEKTQSVSFSNLSVVKKSRGNIFTEKPVFCDNGNSIVVSSGQSVHLYNTATGNHLKELFQCSNNIITCQLHPLESSQLVVITENGELTVYNLKTNEIEYSLHLCLKAKFLNQQKTPKFNADEPNDTNFDWETESLDSVSCRKFFHAVVKPFLDNPSEIFVWATWCLIDERMTHLSAFTFSKGKQIRLIHIQKTGLQKCHLNFVIGTAQGSEIFVGMSSGFVHITRYDSQKHPCSYRHYIGQGKKVTCLAFHPTECSFATGDSLGRIIIWKNIFEKQPLRDVLHWHTLPVHDLFFSKFGNYLFSGGEENVLVKWSLNTRNKDFLPRLSSAIHHISGASDCSLLSVSTMDNKILILDFNFESISAIQHFSKWSILSGENKLTVFTFDPRSNSFILNGKTGHIQFLSLNEDGKFIYTFDVTNRNFITSDADSKIENTEVTLAKFNKDGSWLVTYECRNENICKESRLKFWFYTENQNSFSLVSNVEFPHGENEINALTISGNDVVGTTGVDKKFRLWTVFEHEQSFRKKECWSLFSVNKYRDFSCADIDFSKDASLVSVAFGPVLTIWEVESCELKSSLCVTDKKDDLKFCKFGNFEFSHLVVTGSSSLISGWNLITLSLIWTVPLKLSLLVSDPFSTYMAAFSVNRSLIIFNPSSPNPDFILKNVSDSQVIAGHCMPNENGKMKIYFLTSNQELLSLEDAEKMSASTNIEGETNFVTPFSLQMAQTHNQADFDKRKKLLLNKNNKEAISNLLDSPAHTLPNPSLLCLDVLKGLLVFSENTSTAVPSVKELKNESVPTPNTASENLINVDSEIMENKLMEFFKKRFV